MSPALVGFFFFSGVCGVVQPLLCNHTGNIFVVDVVGYFFFFFAAMPPATNPNAVELLLNCSSSSLVVTTVFKVDLLEYSIHYTCIHQDYAEPVS
jgi:hypothetical protein